jgi:hypothetical protein
MEAKTDTNNEKFEVLRGTLISPMDVHQARSETTQEEMKAKMDIHQEKLEASIHSIWSRETIKHRVEYVLSCVHQKTQCLCKELPRRLMKHRWTYRQ